MFYRKKSGRQIWSWGKNITYVPINQDTLQNKFGMMRRFKTVKVNMFCYQYRCEIMNEEDAGQALQASNLINKKILEFNTATSWNRKTQVPNYTFNLTSNCNFFISNIFWAV